MELNNLKLLPATHPALKTVCEPVTSWDLELIALVEKMREVAKENNLVGLASNQLGVLKQVIIVDLNSANMDNPEYEPNFLVLTNPKVKGIIPDGRSWGWEGCGSIPNWRFMVERYNKIIVDFQSGIGSEMSLEFKGFIAIIIQHEVDHLKGMLVTDRKVRQREKVR